MRLGWLFEKPQEFAEVRIYFALFVGNCREGFGPFRPCFDIQRHPRQESNDIQNGIASRAGRRGQI